MPAADDYELQMLALINAERATAGLQPLRLNSHLNGSAEDHSRWMLQTDVFSHTGVNGSSATERMIAAGYQFQGSWMSAENIAIQSERGAAGIADDVANLHTSLMNSAGHRANILTAAFTEVGIGIEIGQFSSGGVTYTSVIVTQNFALSSADNGGDGSGTSSGTGSGSGSGSGSTPGTALIGGIGNDKLIGTFAGEILDGRAGNDKLYGFAGNDTVTGDVGNDKLFGGDGNDQIDGGAGNDKAYGGTGDDAISGGSGDDKIYGEAGSDTLAGGTGSDKLFGGTEADSFVFDQGFGADRIRDFQDNIDTLFFASAYWEGIEDGAAFVNTYGHVAGGSVVLDFGGGDVATVTGASTLAMLYDDVMAIG
jgi:serralysin